MPLDACIRRPRWLSVVLATSCVTQDGSMLLGRGRVQRYNNQPREPTQQIMRFPRNKAMLGLAAIRPNLKATIRTAEAPVLRLPHPPATSHRMIIPHLNLLAALIPLHPLRLRALYRNSQYPKSIRRSWPCPLLDVPCFPVSTRQSL
jgi:hypothetical protein